MLNFGKWNMGQIVIFKKKKKTIGWDENDCWHSAGELRGKKKGQIYWG